MMTYKKGDKGEIVKQIQRALAAAGLKVMVDGIFGKITEEAIEVFQHQAGLKVDGAVGPATLAKLGIAVAQQYTGLKKSKRYISEIIVHCTATPEGKDYTVDDIRKWHKERGWSDIGYHYVIDRKGHILPGRDVDTIGAHCEGHNAHSIGVVYIGGVSALNGKPKDTRTLAQKAGLIRCLTELKSLYPQAKIYGHCDFTKSKPCPCFDAKTEYASI
jgi:N-acetylmuramoyl-L-alanine amidase